MNSSTIKKLLLQVKQNSCSVEDALAQLTETNSEFTDEACIDHHRDLRTGIPEVIYGASKKARQIIIIARAMKKQGQRILVTRVSKAKAKKICTELRWLKYHKKARMLTGNIPDTNPAGRGQILILTAGTSDIPVAQEAYITLKSLGQKVSRIYDVGVAGIHRILHHRKTLQEASVIIVVAGMEGALPSVAAGLVKCPVIGVPTSVGYGANFSGISALLGMLNSCAPGISVVNIDNGFGAACMALTINRE